jgi:hypothetical protein
MMDTVLLWSQEKSGLEYLVDGKIQGKDVATSGCPAVSYVFDSIALHFAHWVLACSALVSPLWRG